MCALTFAFSLKKDMSNTALAVLFVIMGLAAPAPFYLSPFFDDSLLLPNRVDFFMGILYGGVAYIGGAAILSARVPEKYFPRKFDLIGASHNIWHLAVLTGCALHFFTAVLMYDER